MEPPSNGAEQTVRRGDRLGTTVHQHKRTRAVSILDRPGRKTCLTKEGALLIANHTTNRYGHSVEMAWGCGAKHTTRITHVGKEGGWDIQRTENLGIPTARVGIVQHCPCRIGVICAEQAPTTKVIEEPCVHFPKRLLALPRAPACPRD